MSPLHKINITNLHTHEQMSLLAAPGLYFLSPNHSSKAPSTHTWVFFKGKPLHLNLQTTPFTVDFLGQSPKPIQSLSLHSPARSPLYEIQYEIFEESREHMWAFFVAQLYKLNGDATLTHDRYSQLCSLIVHHNGLPPTHWEQYFENFRFQLLGLGPLEELLKDPTVTEILVQGMDPIQIEREGRLEMTTLRFSSPEELKFTCDKCSQFIEVPFSRAHPICEGSWRGGQRIEIVHTSIAPAGPILCIRKYKPSMQTLERWLETGGMSPSQYRWLQNAIEERLNLLVIGTTGAGKTTLLQGLTQLIPNNQRWISIEDTPEITTEHEGRVRLLTRAANQDGVGGVAMDQLIRASLRLRPDRFVIGEVRGPETLFLIQALSTGHEGSLATLHARSPTEAMERMALMASMHPQAPRAETLRRMIEHTIDGIVHVTRSSDGVRKIHEHMDLRRASRVSRVSSPSVLNLGHLKRDAVISRSQDFVGENNHNKLAVVGHCDGRIEHITMGGCYEKGHGIE